MDNVDGVMKGETENETVPVKKSKAVRQKEYRERKKLQEIAQFGRVLSKVNAESQQKFRLKLKERMRQSEELYNAKKRMNAARSQRYRDRLKLKKLTLQNGCSLPRYEREVIFIQAFDNDEMILGDVNSSFKNQLQASKENDFKIVLLEPKVEITEAAADANNYDANKKEANLSHDTKNNRNVAEDAVIVKNEIDYDISEYDSNAAQKITIEFELEGQCDEDKLESTSEIKTSIPKLRSRINIVNDKEVIKISNGNIRTDRQKSKTVCSKDDDEEIDIIETNRSYNEQQLCKSPDSNDKLKDQSVNFLSSVRNRLLLSACKPVTVDLIRFN